MEVEDNNILPTLLRLGVFVNDFRLIEYILVSLSVITDNTGYN